jgi:hypothetical protein
MRKFFFWLGVVAAAIITLAVAGFGYLAYRGAGLDSESETYASNAVVAITSHWNAKELMSRAAPSLARSVTAEQVSSMFGWLSVLGPLTGSSACQGSWQVNAQIGKPSSTTAQYTCNETYQQSTATIKIALLKSDKKWMITGFHVTSPFLLTHKAVQNAL